MRLVLIFLILLLAGCATDMDRYTGKLIPGEASEGYRVFTYTVPAGSAGTTYPVDSPEAEARRIRWLEMELSDNGYRTDNYVIVSREAILKPISFTKQYDVYYHIKAYKK